MKNRILILVIILYVTHLFAQDPVANANKLQVVTSLTVNKQTEEQYLQAIQNDSNNVIAYYNLGVYYADKYQYDYAEEQYNKAIQKDSNFSLAYTGLASLFLASGQMQRSVMACEKAVQMDSLSAINNLNLGKVYFQNLQFPEAENSFQKAIQLDSANSEIYLNLGTLLMQMDRQSEAISLFKKTFQLNSKDPGAPYSLACIYSLQNQKDDGFAYLELALKNGITFYDMMQVDPSLAHLREQSKQWKALMKKYFPKNTR